MQVQHNRSELDTVLEVFQANNEFIKQTVQLSMAAEEIAKRAIEYRLLGSTARTLFEELLSAGVDVLGRELTHEEAYVLYFDIKANVLGVEATVSYE